MCIERDPPSLARFATAWQRSDGRLPAELRQPIELRQHLVWRGIRQTEEHARDPGVGICCELLRVGCGAEHRDRDRCRIATRAFRSLTELADLRDDVLVHP